MAPCSVSPVYRVLPVSSGSASLTEPLSGFHPLATSNGATGFPVLNVAPALRDAPLSMLLSLAAWIEETYRHCPRTNPLVKRVGLHYRHFSHRRRGQQTG